MSHLQSSGRGGAGNIVDSTKSPKIEPKDLETPVLTSGVVTTGRGGTGNMAKNVGAAETRALQDVEPVPRRDSTHGTHIGRGGDGNVFKPSPEEIEAAKKAGSESAISDDSSGKNEKEKESLAARGKQWLSGLGKKENK